MEYFKLNKQKVLEAIVYILNKIGGSDHHKILKILFYADKLHLNNYGRPVCGDVYRKMTYGPVGSFARDILQINERRLKDFKPIVEAAIHTEKVKPFPLSYSLRMCDDDEFSETDLECLDSAIAFCKDKTFGQLTDETHKEKSWIEASENGVMDYVNFVDEGNPYASEIKKELESGITKYMVV